MNRYAHEDVGDQRAAAGCGVAPRRVTQALCVFYLIGALLNGEHLLRQAELMPFGTWRDVCVTAAKPLAKVSEVTRLSAPRHWLESRFDAP